MTVRLSLSVNWWCWPRQFWGPERVLLTGEGIIHYKDRVDLTSRF